MLFALRQPATLLGLVLGFAVGCFLRVTAQQLIVNGRSGIRRSGRSVTAHSVTTPMTWLDPFGLVAALLAGIGWSPRPVLSRGKPRQVWSMVVIAVVVHGALAAIGLVAYLGAGGLKLAFPVMSTISVLHGTQFVATTFAEKVALGFGVENLGCGLLALVPIPPLELGVALWSTLPRSAGSRRMAYRVLEEQWGIGILLLLLLLPLAGEQPALLQLVAGIADKILHAL
jgi:hypothetical protein